MSLNNFTHAYTYDDIALVPQYNNIPSRTIPSLESWITRKTKIDNPILAANMDTVIGDSMADALIANGLTTIEILREYPDLEAEDIRASLLYAAFLANEEVRSFAGMSA